MRSKFFFSIIALALYMIPYGANADVAYRVFPLVIDMSAEARDIITKEITIENIADQQITVYPTVNNISLSDGGSIEEFLPPSMSDRTRSLASWLEISRMGITVNPGETKTVSLTLRVHPSPVPGTYHALIGFGNGNNRDIAERHVASGQAPGTVVTVTIGGDTNTFMKLSKFIVDRVVTGPSNQAAVYTFNNPGDEPLIPTGEIILYDSTGKEVGALPVNAEGIEIPPGGEHSFTAEVPVEGLFGKYKAFLSVEYGSSERASVHDTSFFYVFPLKTILILLGVLVCIVGILSWYFHRKYFDEDLVDDSERLTVHVRDSQSESKVHDLDLKKRT